MAIARSRVPRVFVDRPLLFLTVLLMLFGLVMVFSSSANMAEQRFGSAYLFLRKQLVWDAIGGVVLLVCMRTNYHNWQRWALPLVGLATVLLSLVLVVGRVVKGARRWIHLGPLTFQPSEVAKLALILWLANYLDRRQSQLKDFRKGFLPPILVMGVLLVLILKEPDLGTPMMLGSVSMIMLFLAGAKWQHLASLVGASLIPLYYELFHVGYRQRRLMSFTNPWADASGAGYQLTQSLYAFGSGGLFGKGLGASTLKLLALPDPHTDFIFPVIGEELGFVGAFVLIILFALWGLRGWQAARRAPDLFGQLLAAGITSWVLIQASINMGVSCGLLPTKGLPLPFVSFGGSSLVITLAAVGILLNISAYGQPDTRADSRVSRRKGGR